ncbi:DUF1223 domain-containing protein [Dongia sp.]|uniref:DUF1223 domain-containing protein n=1 Tax=Dongia sp. TaxID=1977262 RepID=UPI0035AFC5BB
MLNRILPAALLALALILPAGLAAAQSGSDFAQPFNSPSGPAPGAPGIGGMAAPGEDAPSVLAPAQPPPLEPSVPVLAPVALETPPAPIVVELFTSEGCSSCPSANDYLRELARRRNLLPLSFHVDYWDYIGWKDRFADPAFADRQRAYAAARGKSMMYTPQMVVAGALEVVGSDRKAVEGALKKADRRHAMYSLSLGKDAQGGIHLQLPQATLSVPASLWLVTYVYEGATDIQAGENRGRHMITTNVVRSLRKVGQWNGAPEDWVISLTREEIAGKPDACAIIANEAEFGPVVAAAAWDFKDLW